MKFIRYVDSYQYKNLKGYLLIIARNLCFDFFRHKKETVWIEEIAEAGKDDAQIKSIEDGLLIKQALLKIPMEQREVIILKIYEEMKFMEIARMLGCNVSTAKSRYHAGLEKLRKIMEEESEE